MSVDSGAELRQDVQSLDRDFATLSIAGQRAAYLIADQRVAMFTLGNPLPVVPGEPVVHGYDDHGELSEVLRFYLFCKRGGLLLDQALDRGGFPKNRDWLLRNKAGTYRWAASLLCGVGGFVHAQQSGEKHYWIDDPVGACRVACAELLAALIDRQPTTVEVATVDPPNPVLEAAGKWANAQAEKRATWSAIRRGLAKRKNWPVYGDDNGVKGFVKRYRESHGLPKFAPRKKGRLPRKGN